MSKKTIIGLVGVKQSGKSTATNIIKKYFPFAEESALADKLKNTCADVFELKREQFDLQELKEVPFKTPIILTEEKIKDILESFKIKGVNIKITCKNVINMELTSPRHIAQIIGTEVLRQAGKPSVHCDNVDLTKSNVMIISDVRFHNELDYFNNKDKFDFIPLYLHRKLAESKVTEKSHQSEKEVFEFRDKCLKLDNNSTLEDLERQILCVLQTSSSAFQK